jgi:hypothetical protein
LKPITPCEPHEFETTVKEDFVSLKRLGDDEVALLLASRHRMTTKCETRNSLATLIFKDREGGPSTRDKMDQSAYLKRLMKPKGINVTWQRGKRSSLPLGMRSEARLLSL